MCGEKKQGGCCQKPEKLETSNNQKCNPEKTKECHGQEEEHTCCCKK